MKAELLVGGSWQSGGQRRSGRVRRPESGPAPKVGFGFLLPLIVCGAAFVAVGAWRVDIVQQQRNFQMETARLQQIDLQHRDRTKVLSARLSQLQRAEYLRAAAMESLGMVEPPPAEISALVVSEDSINRWRVASEVAALNIQRKEESP